MSKTTNKATNKTTNTQTKGKVYGVGWGEPADTNTQSTGKVANTDGYTQGTSADIKGSDASDQGMTLIPGDPNNQTFGGGNFGGTGGGGSWGANDTAVADASLAEKSVAESKIGLTKIDNAKETRKSAYKPVEKDNTDITSKVVKPATSEGATINNDINNQTSNNTDGVDPQVEEADKLDKEVTTVLEKESYEDALNTMKENDAMYQNEVDKYNALAERIDANNYDNDPTIIALLAEKKKGLEDLKAFNDRVLQTANTNMYHTGGFRYQNSASELYIKEQIDANQEKYDAKSAEYDNQIALAKEKLAEKDERNMERAWSHAKELKGEMSDIIKTQHNLEKDYNAERRANQKMTMDRGEYEMGARDIQAQQLGKLLASNPGIDVQSVISENGWDYIDKGGLALANSYAIKEKLSIRQQQAQIAASNRSNQPKVDDSSRTWIKGRTKQLIQEYKAAGKTYNEAELLEQAKKEDAARQTGGAVNKQKPVGFDKWSESDKQDWEKLSGNSEYNNNLSAMQNSVKSIQSELERVNNGSIMLGESRDVDEKRFESKLKEARQNAKLNAGYYNMDDKSKKDFNDAWNKMSGWYKYGTKRDETGLGEIADTVWDMEANAISGAVGGAVNKVGSWLGDDDNKPNVLENSLGSYAENLQWQWEQDNK